jgi:hypothetical protein
VDRRPVPTAQLEEARTRAIQALGAHFAEDHLTVDELEARLALMGGVIRRGVWSVPARLRAIALIGGVEIDLREAILTAAVTEIRAFAIMGAVVVRVPPNVRVESDGIAILGGFEDQLEHPAAANPSAPVVRLTGFSFMGGVEAKVETPDAP